MLQKAEAPAEPLEGEMNLRHILTSCATDPPPSSLPLHCCAAAALAHVVAVLSHAQPAVLFCLGESFCLLS